MARGSGGERGPREYVQSANVHNNRNFLTGNYRDGISLIHYSTARIFPKAQTDVLPCVRHPIIRSGEYQSCWKELQIWIIRVTNFMLSN